MCGIISYFSPTGEYDVGVNKMLRELLSVDTLRGDNSTGLMYEDETYFHTYKKAVSGFDFIQLKAVSNIIRNYNDSRFLVGHNRAATAGAVTTQNAHPFIQGKIVGVHNGTLNNYRNLAKQGFHSQVDSEYIFKGLDESSSEEVISKINGSFCLIWYNREEDKIHLVRNQERPYTFATIHGTEAIVGCSERLMLEWIADRNDIYLTDFVTPDPMTEYIFDLNDVTNPQTVKHEKKQFTTYYGKGRGAYGNDYSQGQTKYLHKGQKHHVAHREPEVTEFLVQKYYPNTTVTEGTSMNFGRYVGTSIDGESIIIYHCQEGSLILGGWYEGISNHIDHDDVHTITRSSVKRITGDQGTGGIYSCVSCDDIVGFSQCLFVDKEPLCLKCCKKEGVSIKDENVSTSPIKKEKGRLRSVH